MEVDGMKPSKNSDLGKQTRLTRPPWREEGAAFPSFLARVVAHRIHESLEPAALVLEQRQWLVAELLDQMACLRQFLAVEALNSKDREVINEVEKLDGPTPVVPAQKPARALRRRPAPT